MPDMPGMDMPEHAAHGAPPVGLGVLAALLALYLVAHAAATVVVVVRRTRRADAEEPAAEEPDAEEPAAEEPAAPAVGVLGASVGTPPGPGGVAVAEAPAVPRGVSVLAHGPVQLIGQAGMSLAMAVVLCLL
jgi:hypothetical protein